MRFAFGRAEIGVAFDLTLAFEVFEGALEEGLVLFFGP